MTKKLREPAPDPRIRVGVIGVAPMRAIGLQSLFHDSAVIPRIVIVQADILKLLRDPTLRILILGARSSAALIRLMGVVKAYRTDVRVIVMSSATEDEAIVNVIGAGAKGHIHDTATLTEVQQAIQIVVHGSVWAPRHALSLLIERITQDSKHGSVRSSTYGSAATATPGHVSFTNREHDVLQLLVDGRPNKEIAKALRIEEQTVKVYVGKLMRKVGVTSRTALTMHAVTNALLDAPR